MKVLGRQSWASQQDVWERWFASMSNFDTWWAFCMRPENDGQANDAAPGEPWPTRWGWTLPTWVTARRWMGFTGASIDTFNAQTPTDMGALAYEFFWRRQGGKYLPNGLDLVVIDWVWTSGGAAMDIQQNLGLRDNDVDGIIGPRTSRLLQMRSNPEQLVHAWRVAYYDAIGLRDVYPGLYRRADQTLAIAQAMTGSDTDWITTDSGKVVGMKRPYTVYLQTDGDGGGVKI